MKLAVPVKMNTKNPAVAPLFGKAKWFALIENGTISIEANPCHGGQAVIEWLTQRNVNVLLVQEIGQSPYLKLKSYENIALYHTGFERVLLQDLLTRFKTDKLTHLDDNTIQKIRKHHNKRHHTHEHSH